MVGTEGMAGTAWVVVQVVVWASELGMGMEMEMETESESVSVGLDCRNLNCWHRP